MTRRTWMRFPLYILAVVLPQPMTVATAAEPDCARIEFPLETHYSVSAAQTTDGDLLVLDFRNERLIRVDLQDGSWGAVGGWAGEILRDRQPVAIRSSGSSVLLEQASPARLVALDPHDLGIRPGMTYQVNESVGTEGHVLDSMWTWEVVGSDVVACSDLYVGTGRVEDQDNWYSGIVRFPLVAPSQYELLLKLDLDSRTALACRLAMPVIAPLGNKVYLLELTDRPRILVSSPDAPAPRELTGVIPKQFEFISQTLRPDEDNSFILQAIEDSIMPIGVFGWRGELHLLSRSPANDGSGTDWWLTRIDPERELAIGTARIASRALNLMVVPGAERWALIEKGHVDSFEDQDLESVIVVPASELRDWTPDKIICGSPDG